MQHSESTTNPVCNPTCVNCTNRSESTTTQCVWPLIIMKLQEGMKFPKEIPTNSWWKSKHSKSKTLKSLTLRSERTLLISPADPVELVLQRLGPKQRKELKYLPEVWGVNRKLVGEYRSRVSQAPYFTKQNLNHLEDILHLFCSHWVRGGREVYQGHIKVILSSKYCSITVSLEVLIYLASLLYMVEAGVREVYFPHHWRKWEVYFLIRRKGRISNQLK